MTEIYTVLTRHNDWETSKEYFGVFPSLEKAIEKIKEKFYYIEDSDRYPIDFRFEDDEKFYNYGDKRMIAVSASSPRYRYFENDYSDLHTAHREYYIYIYKEYLSD